MCLSAGQCQCRPALDVVQNLSTCTTTAVNSLSGWVDKAGPWSCLPDITECLQLPGHSDRPHVPGVYVDADTIVRKVYMCIHTILRIVAGSMCNVSPRSAVTRICVSQTVCPSQRGWQVHSAQAPPIYNPEPVLAQLPESVGRCLFCQGGQLSWLSGTASLPALQKLLVSAAQAIRGGPTGWQPLAHLTRL